MALADITLFESEGNYTRVHFGAEQALMLRSLNQLEEKLDAAQFFRANRRQIVSLAQIARVAPADGDGLRLQLAGGTMIEVSRRRAQQFRAANCL